MRLLRLLWAFGPLCSGVAQAASFSWSGPEDCPGEEDVHARLVRDFSAELDTLGDASFGAVARRIDAGFELELTVRRNEQLHERRIRAASCDELVDALVAAVSLALQSLGPDNAEPTPSTDAPSAREPGEECSTLR